MPSGWNNMDNKLDYRVLFMQALIDTNNEINYDLKQDYNKLKKKLNKHDFKYSEIKELLNKVLVQYQNFLS